MVQRIYHNISTTDGRYYALKMGEVNPKTSGNKYVTQCAYTSIYEKADGKRYPRGTGRTEFCVGEPIGAAATYSSSDTNRLYAKLTERLHGGVQASLLTASAEWKLSLDMVSSRANQLLQSYLAIRRGAFGSGAGIAGMSKHRRKSIAKRRRNTGFSPTELWLEYWMGWAPMFGDIYNALEIITRDNSPNHFSVGVPVKSTYVQVYGSPKDALYRQERCVLNGRISAYGDYKVINHNLNRLNQQGLVNPARTAWELVPFSFAVDWLLNVGQVLGSLTDFAGLNLSNTGQARKLEHSATKVGWDRVYDYTTQQYRREYFSVKSSRVEYRRVPGSLPSPQLTIKFDRLSLTRAATSISLLNEIFLKK